MTVQSLTTRSHHTLRESARCKGICYHMLTEKEYASKSRQRKQRILNKRLVGYDHESTQAYELLKFIRSQVQK
ncbi:hypothetical protein Tco_0807355 [Tanacetum coccineum]